ncbi:MAG: sigma-70 family RNA polymerase sigma factor [Acidobacteriota bacterium]
MRDLKSQAVNLDEEEKEKISIKQEQSDEELIAACLDRSVYAWETLIERYQSLIYSIPIKYGLGQQDAADIFQNTCVKLVEKLPNLRDHSKFRSWLITMVVRQCWRVRQRQCQETPISNFLEEEQDELGWELPAEIQSADQWLIELECRHQIHTAFAQLSQRCQQLLNYLFFRDPPATYKEIAAETGLDLDSIGSARCRCLEKLKFLYDRVNSKRVSRKANTRQVKKKDQQPLTSEEEDLNSDYRQ